MKGELKQKVKLVERHLARLVQETDERVARYRQIYTSKDVDEGKIESASKVQLTFYFTIAEKGEFYSSNPKETTFTLLLTDPVSRLNYESGAMMRHIKRVMMEGRQACRGQWFRMYMRSASSCKVLQVDTPYHMTESNGPEIVLLFENPDPMQKARHAMAHL